MEKSLQLEIEEQYKSIYKKWLFLHFMVIVGETIFIFLMELGIGKKLYDTGYIYTTSNIYLLKYLIIPTLINCFIILIAYLIYFSKKVTLDTKILTISLLSVVICFVVYTAHGTFNSLYFIFVAPILLTAIYGRYRVTIITSIFSLTCLITSELFITYNQYKISSRNDGYTLSNFLISIFILCTFIVISLVIIYFEKEKNSASLKKEVERHELRLKIQIDELTQTYNRKALRKAMNEIQDDKTDNTYTFVMIDIDNFKLLNDTLGHIAGDHFLIELCNIMKIYCDDAHIYRYGGDEFSIIFKNYTNLQIVNVCESIQMNFEKVSLGYKTKLPITLSFGIANYNDNQTPSELIKNADTALYHSKKIKNETTIFDEILI